MSNLPAPAPVRPWGLAARRICAASLTVAWVLVAWVTWSRNENSFGVWLLGPYWYWFALAVWVVGFLGTAALLWAAWRRVLPVVLVALLIGATAAVAQPLSPRMFRFDSQDWFEEHRADFAEVARLYGTDCCETYMGSELVDDLRYLSVNGRVVSTDGALFLPQWFGIPDDAGGYFYSPEGSPAGQDMYGMFCKNPVDLGEDWWMCGL